MYFLWVLRDYPNYSRLKMGLRSSLLEAVFEQLHSMIEALCYIELRQEYDQGTAPKWIQESRQT